MKAFSLMAAVITALSICCSCSLVESFNKNALPDAIVFSDSTRVAFRDVKLYAEYDGRVGKNAEFGIL